jgi:Lrp/AsnC family transcriptional regulator for asnA, asnC and gidA
VREKMTGNLNENYVRLDKTDHKILEIINKDARTPYRQISRDLDISVGTVHNRVDKLIKTGVIKKFAPIMDHRKLGYGLTSIIGVRVKGGKLENWENKKSFDTNVLGIYDVTGEYDAFLIAKFKDTDELDKFIKDLLKEPDVERTYTQTVLNVVKEDLGSANML